MFPRRQRLSRAAFPTAAKAQGGTKGRVNTPHFAFSASGEAEGYAIVVAKAVARLAVTRHRLKRQVAAVLRGLPPARMPRALIIYARTGAPALSYAEIKAEIEAGIGKIA